MSLKVILGYFLGVSLVLVSFLAPVKSQDSCWDCQVLGTVKCMYEPNIDDCDINPLNTCACTIVYCQPDPTCEPLPL